MFYVWIKKEEKNMKRRRNSYNKYSKANSTEEATKNTSHMTKADKKQLADIMKFAMLTGAMTNGGYVHNPVITEKDNNTETPGAVSWDSVWGNDESEDWYGED